MKVGGNASASDFFTRHGGSTLLADSDTRKKYTSRAAELYKEELARRVKEDIARQAPRKRFPSHRVSPLILQVPQPRLRRRHARNHVIRR